jgi:hypothetical protein
MPSEILWKRGDVFALLDAISSGMTLSHERCIPEFSLPLTFESNVDLFLYL